MNQSFLPTRRANQAPASHSQLFLPEANICEATAGKIRSDFLFFFPGIMVIREGLGRLMLSQSYNGTFTTDVLLLLYVLEYES